MGVGGPGYYGGYYGGPRPYYGGGWYGYGPRWYGPGPYYYGPPAVYAYPYPYPPAVAVVPAHHLDDPPCHALVWSYTESAVLYRARYHIADFRRINFIHSDVGARIWYRLRREGIEIDRHIYEALLAVPEGKLPELS